jgi:CRP/FNR family cyclic AMP-dependent transcriptional regulator
MPCDPSVLKGVPLFAQLDDEETAVLAGQVELKRFQPRQRIYKMGDPGGQAYIVVSGIVRLTTMDEDFQEVVLNEPGAGEFFGLASMLEGTVHQTTAMALEEAECIEINPQDIQVLLRSKPMSGMDMLTVLGRHIHATQNQVRLRSTRNVNELIERKATVGERIADAVAHFGGSWSFIIAFAFILVGYTWINSSLALRAWDPYPFILLNLFLSMLAAVQAPVIMMSQNRQDAKDRLRNELDYDVNRRAEQEIRDLARKVNLLRDMIDDLEELIRAGKSSR